MDLALLQTAFIQIRLWDIPLCAAGILPSLDYWMGIFVAYMFLFQSLTTGCDYLINLRAILVQKGKGEVGKARRRLTFILKDLEADSPCSYDVLLLLLSLKGIG